MVILIFPFLFGLWVCNHAEALAPLWNLIPVVLKTSSGGDHFLEVACLL